MGNIIQASAGLIGLAIIACVAHSAVMASGGYTAHGAPLLITLACGLAMGAVVVGVAWRDRRYTIAWLIAAALVAGEGYAMLLTSERTLDQRELKQAPIREAFAALERAEERIRAAETSLAALTTTPRLERAIAAKVVADLAVVERAAEQHCAANCRALLEQQVIATGAEMSAAQEELASLVSAAQRELDAAHHALMTFPSPPSASPLADRLGLAGWQIDLLAAALAGVAANGLGAFLVAFAAHSGPQTVPARTYPRARDPTMEADEFARSTFRPNPCGHVKLIEVRATYHEWCAAHALEPLTDREIGEALSKMFEEVGLYRRGSGAEAVIIGLGWATSSLPTR